MHEILLNGYHHMNILNFTQEYLRPIIILERLLLCMLTSNCLRIILKTLRMMITKEHIFSLFLCFISREILSWWSIWSDLCENVIFHLSHTDIRHKNSKRCPHKDWSCLPFFPTTNAKKRLCSLLIYSTIILSIIFLNI